MIPNYIILFTVFLIQPIFASAAADASSSAEVMGRQPSWGLRLLQMSKENGEKFMVSMEKILSREKDRIWTKEDFYLAAPTAEGSFKDQRLGKLVPQIRERLQSKIDYLFDGYSLLTYIEAEAKKGRPLHEISDLFLRGEELKTYANWFESQIVSFVNNLIQSQIVWESLLQNQNSQSGLDNFANASINNLVEYLKSRIARVEGGECLLTFQDVSRRCSLVHQHMNECNRFRFEQEVLMVKCICKAGFNDDVLGKSAIQELFKVCPSLTRFLQGQEDIMKDADSYLEERSWKVFVNHRAMLGDKEDIILGKLTERLKPVFTYGEQATSRQQNRLEDRTLKIKFKKAVAAAVSNYIKEAIKLHNSYLTKLLAEQQKDREFLRQEREAHKAAVEKRTAELHAALEARAAARAADSLTFAVTMAPAASSSSSSSSCSSSSSSFSYFTPTEETLSPLPKAKIKTRGTPDSTKAAEERSEKDEKGTVEEKDFPIYEVSKDLLELHGELMGPYFAKFGWGKLERLATAFGMEITTPGHGGDHRGLKYRGIEGTTKAISIPIRSAYGPRFFTMIRNFFAEVCHLDKAHLQLVGS